jgi:hypothetical protein
MASMVLGGLNPKVPNTKCECTFKPTYNSKEQQEHPFQIPFAFQIWHLFEVSSWEV